MRCCESDREWWNNHMRCFGCERVRGWWNKPQSAQDALHAASTSITAARWMVVIMTFVFVAFMFSQPLLSWLLNDVFEEFKILCTTPAKLIECGSGESYELIADRLGRRNEHNELVGCSCGEGILRDWACAANTTSFSISYFISSAPGTGIMAALSFWPAIGMWLYGAGTVGYLACHGAHPWVLKAITYTLVSFQFFYGLFLVDTTCVAPRWHAIAVMLFNISAVAHYTIVAYAVGAKKKSSRYIRASCSVGVVSIALGSLFPIGPSWLGQHAFWLGECIGLTAGLAIAPILIVIHDPEELLQPLLRHIEMQQTGSQQVDPAETPAAQQVNPAETPAAQPDANP